MSEVWQACASLAATLGGGTCGSAPGSCRGGGAGPPFVGTLEGGGVHEEMEAVPPGQAGRGRALASKLSGRASGCSSIGEGGDKHRFGSGLQKSRAGAASTAMVRGRDSEEPPGVEGIEPPEVVLVGEFMRGMGASGSAQSDWSSFLPTLNSKRTVVMSSHDETGVAWLECMMPSRPELLMPRPERFLRSRCRRFWNHTWIWRVDTPSSAPSCLRVSTFGN